MYYLDDVDHNSMAAHLTRNDWKVWRSAVISSAVDGTDEDVLWNVRSECEEDEGTDCEDGDSDNNW